MHPEDIPLFDKVIARAANGDGFDCEYRLLLPRGAVKQVHVVAHAVRGEFGTHEFVGAVMDITATRQAEAALRHAQAELAHVTRVTTMGELAASIAHEVNQPIAGVLLLDVMDRFLNLRDTNAECAIALLPSKVSEVWKGSMNPSR